MYTGGYFFRGHSKDLFEVTCEMVMGYSKENLKIHTSGVPSPPFLPSLTLPFHSSSPAFPSHSPFLPSYISLPLEVGSLKYSLGSGERCKLPQRAIGVWGGALAEIDFGAFLP